MPSYRKKLIEVALPLDAINKESAREKSIRHGHPSTLHLWWARRPLAACRAVLFAQMVDDPSEYMPDEKSADEERERLFDLIEELVKWENINNEEVLDKARLEIAKSVARDLGEPVPVGKQAVREFLVTKAPPVLDPFAGGGSIPLEAQRLGLRAYASDLNPVAVLINKALIEIPPKFAGIPPVHPPENKEQQLSLMKKEWKGAEGLAEDVRYYGKWMRDEAEKQIGYLYPKMKVTPELLAERHDLRIEGYKVGDELTVIAWIWARTVRCPNPACSTKMPLVRSFALSTKKNEKTWIEPKIDRSANPPIIQYGIKSGKGNMVDGTVRRGGSQCLACGTPVPFDYIRSEGKSGNLENKMMAIICEGKGRRIYLPPTNVHVNITKQAINSWMPEGELPLKHRNFQTPAYGMTKVGELFTTRQLVSLNKFSSLIKRVIELVVSISETTSQIGDALDERKRRYEYAIAIATYLGLTVSRQSNRLSTICFWDTGGEKVQQVFARQAIPMTWDFVEANPFSNSSGNWIGQLEFPAKNIEYCPSTNAAGIVDQKDAMSTEYGIENIIISTDPPYYDNICYAELSDYFYVWLRRSLGDIYPTLFSTILTPKNTELIASPNRFGGDKEKAEEFFEKGLSQTFHKLNQISSKSFPVTIYYAYKQAENNDIGIDPLSKSTEIASTGWEKMLDALLSSGFEITGTWPMRTEFERGLKRQMNALASSIILVCRPRKMNLSIVSRREFLTLLKRDLPLSLIQLQQGFIAPVDFAQAAIGPGMAVFSRYSKVLEADGSPMSVRTALALINQALDEFLAEQEGEYDTDTRWVLAWYEQYGFNDGPYGVAETLSKAKNTSVSGLEEAGVLAARAGKVRLLSRDELKEEWDPSQDKRPTAWEAVQYLIRALDIQGEQAAAILLSRLGGLGETARDLAYRLYTICERKGWAQDALGYNMLVVAWPRLKELARSAQGPGQERLL